MDPPSLIGEGGDPVLKEGVVGVVVSLGCVELSAEMFKCVVDGLKTGAFGGVLELELVQLAGSDLDLSAEMVELADLFENPVVGAQFCEVPP